MPKFTWTTDAQEAEREQKALREMLKLESLELGDEIECLAVGVSYDRSAKIAYAVAVRSSVDGGPLEGRPITATAEVDFPYVAGLYAYREGPAVCELLDGLEVQPDLVLFDSQGIAHPRGFGLASHIGVLYDLPTIGLTRTNLFGTYSDPPAEARVTLPIKHGTRTLGYAVRLTDSCKPIFISPGHRVDLSSLQRWIRQLTRHQRCMPASLQKAHAIANRVTRRRRV